MSPRDSIVSLFIFYFLFIIIETEEREREKKINSTKKLKLL